VDQALAAGENQAANRAKLDGAYDYIVVGAGSSGSIIAGELTESRAGDVPIESAFILAVDITAWFKRMRLRGLSGARDEFHLAAIVQNLKTMALRLLGPPTGQVCA
jgi:hypothetical protein